jgi:hypothetical protein
VFGLFSFFQPVVMLADATLQRCWLRGPPDSKTTMTRILTLTLALLIAVTSQQMAMARAVTKDAQGQVILCTGQGPLTVTLDAQGNPIGPVHICPDCALTLMAYNDVPIAVKTPVVHIQTIAQTPVSTRQIGVIPIPTKARDPPVLV